MASTYDVLARLHQRFREQRARLFVRLMQPPVHARVLDLGSGTGSFSRLIAQHCPLQVTMADVLDHSGAAAQNGAAFVQLQETGPLPFPDRAFDIVLCNSVIEHATASVNGQREAEWRPASWQVQQAFAAEIRRVGNGYFVQTPHRDFPIDMHLWLPFTNWLPHQHLERMRPLVDRYWIKGCDAVDWNLLRTQDMRTLFPDARLHVEKLAGLPKSIIAYRRVSS
jgi:SAM-dependent methyltransferase